MVNEHVSAKSKTGVNGLQLEAWVSNAVRHLSGGLDSTGVLPALTASCVPGSGLAAAERQESAVCYEPRHFHVQQPYCVFDSHSGL